MPPRAILFDFDGTLVQTREASWELFAQTNREFGLGIEDRDAFFDLFNDNFFRALAARCPDKTKLDAAKHHFLELLRTQYTPPLVPGLADVVRTLASRCTLVVLSTNTIATIRRVLSEAGVATCFAHVFSGDVEPDKSVSMRRFLADAGYGVGRRCSPAYDELNGARDEGGVALITDTAGDVKEALACGVRAIGVAWGMHGESELLAAGAETVAVWPQELIAWLASGEPAPGATACLLPPKGACACESATATSCACSHEPAATAAERVAAAARVRRARNSERLEEARRTRFWDRSESVLRSEPPPAVPRAPPPSEPELLATLRRLRHIQV